MINAKEMSSVYSEWRWKYLSGVDREGLDIPMSFELVKKEETHLREEAIRNGVDPTKIDANLLYLKKKYACEAR